MICADQHPTIDELDCERELYHRGLHQNRDHKWATRANPPDRRPGTVLDHRFTEAIRVTVQRKDVEVGLLDRRHRVFQSGGEASNFIYWKRSLITLPALAWRMVEGRCDAVEWVDHHQGAVYSLRLRASLQPIAYNDGIGDRVGWPVMYAERSKIPDPEQEERLPAGVRQVPTQHAEGLQRRLL